jgi:hypothetical protein
VLFLSLNTTTLLLADLVLVSLVVAPEHVPGGYWLLIYASAIEGLIGGTFLPIELSDVRSHCVPGQEVLPLPRHFTHISQTAALLLQGPYFYAFSLDTA